MPTQLLLHVRRTALGPVLAQAPQQSDYVAEWGRGDGGSTEVGPVNGGFAQVVAEWRDSFPRLAGMVQAVLTGLRFYRAQSLWNPRFFQKAPEFRPRAPK